MTQIPDPSPGNGPDAGAAAGATAPPPPLPPGGTAATTLDDAWSRLRLMRRSRDDRMVAGVAGGAARALGVDPLFLRVVLVVLALFGGVGVVLYALAWLLVPAEDVPVSVAEQAVGRGGQRAGAGTILLAVLLGVIVIGALISSVNGWDGALLLVLAVVGLVLLLERGRGTRAPVAVGPGVPYAAGPEPSGPTPQAAQLAAAEPGAEPGSATTQVLPGQGTPPPPLLPPYATGPAWQPPAPPPAPRERSALLPATVSLVLVALGVLGVIDAAGASVPWGAYWATALAVVGLGLLVGTWYGRSRLLVLLGIVLALGTASSLAADSWGDQERVELTQRYTSAAAIPGSADYGSGSVTYDLRDVDFTGRDVDVDLSIGAGELLVIVPSDVDVRASASVGVGEIDLLDRSRGGFGGDVSTVDLGEDGIGGGTLRLDLNAGVGSVEVRRG